MLGPWLTFTQNVVCVLIKGDKLIYCHCRVFKTGHIQTFRPQPLYNDLKRGILILGL